MDVLVLSQKAKKDKTNYFLNSNVNFVFNIEGKSTINVNSLIKWFEDFSFTSLTRHQIKRNTTSVPMLP